MGMSHRGRLNVLANIVGKSYAQIFREFEGELDPNVPQGSGDVKYHVGATGMFKSRSRHRRSTSRWPRTPATSKPSIRSSKEWPAPSRIAAPTSTTTQCCSVLVHGDAAFAGQGVVAETLNLSELPGYDVGGTVHIVVNNQVGFTTTPGFARSTVYATDIAKAVQAPIFHVNGDDPEASMRVTQLAFAFRQAFKKDVVVDMVCYRRYGHNEGDEPAFTLPAHVRSDRATPLGAQALHRAAREPRRPHARRRREGARRLPRPGSTPRSKRRACRTRRSRGRPTSPSHPTRPRLRADRDRRAARRARTDHRRARDGSARLHGSPQAAAHHRQPAQGARRPTRSTGRSPSRSRSVRSSSKATPVRLAGQDTRRGTFSQRHAVLVDHVTEAEYTPLAHLGDAAAPFMVLRLRALGVRGARLRVRLFGRRPRRARVLGSAVRRLRQRRADDHRPVHRRRRRQVGPAAAASCCCSRTASKARAPSTRRPGSSVSSCCAPTTTCASSTPRTAAQYFHVLRRQVHDRDRKPMIVMTPKRYLRMPATYSTASAARDGRVPARAPRPRGAGSRDRSPGSCSAPASSAHELLARRDEIDAPVAIVRIEQLYPWPEREIAAELARYPARRGRVGAGRAGQHGRPLLRPPPHRGDVHRGRTVGVVARPASPSPASGSSTVHDAQQQALLEEAIPA